MRALKLPAIGLLMLLPAHQVHAAGDADPDWPCVQRKIPNLSAGMMWAGPPPDETTQALWENDDALARLVAGVSARRTSLDEARMRISEYAESLATADRRRRLTALFAGALFTINAERAQIMAGIRKYSRKQKALADAIRSTRIELSNALKGKSEKDKNDRRELEQKLIWQSRVHEERERSLQFVCESPVILEQRAFALAREIAHHLEE